MRMTKSAFPSMTTGLDPEVFITDENDKLIVGERVVDVAASNKDALVVHDNAAVEFRTGGRGCLEGLHDEVMNRLITIDRLARGEGGKISLTPCMPLEEEDMGRESVMEFGCSPASRINDTGAIEPVEPLADPHETPLRSAGFHIHIGGPGRGWHEAYSRIERVSKYPFGNAQFATIRVIRDKRFRERYVSESIAAMDVLVGLPGVVFESMDDVEAARQRRNILGYGRAGEFRFERGTGGTPPKLEYRVLSPWPLNHPVWSWWACSMARNACMLTIGDWKKKAIVWPDRRDVTQAINEVDGAAAKDLFKAARAAIYEVYGEALTGHQNRWQYYYNDYRAISGGATARRKQPTVDFSANQDAISHGNVRALEFAFDKGLDIWYDNDAPDILKRWRESRRRATRYFPYKTRALESTPKVREAGHISFVEAWTPTEA
jgi:hypothetical protein